MDEPMASIAFYLRLATLLAFFILAGIYAYAEASVVPGSIATAVGTYVMYEMNRRSTPAVMITIMAGILIRNTDTNAAVSRAMNVPSWVIFGSAAWGVVTFGYAALLFKLGGWPGLWIAPAVLIALAAFPGVASRISPVIVAGLMIISSVTVGIYYLATNAQVSPGTIETFVPLILSVGSFFGAVVLAFKRAFVPAIFLLVLSLASASQIHAFGGQPINESAFQQVVLNRVRYLLAQGQSGTSSWTDPSNPVSLTTTIGPTYTQPDGVSCREVSIIAVIQGNQGSQSGKGCLINGQWNLYKN
jgi:hypothetical protein